MTEDELIKALINCDTGDPEVDHGNADDVLCDFLNSIGFKRAVEAYNKIDKWYA